MDFNKPIVEQISNNGIVEGVRNTASTLATDIGDGLATSKSSLNNVVSDYSSTDVAESGSDFLQSNSIIAKFAFIILVLIGFFILLNLGIYIIGLLTKPSLSPYIFKGKYDLQDKKRIRQDPKKGVVTKRSNDEDKGIEFTWSTWLKVGSIHNGLDNVNDMHIFNKGDEPTPSGSADVNGPGLYASKNDENLDIEVKMDLFGENEPTSITINNLPVGKWFHLAIRLQNKIMDVYVNGTITTREPFMGVPKQNYGDIFVGYNAAMGGSISNLRYFDHALSVFHIANIVWSGPDLSSADDKDIKPDYLSGNWYANQE
jgi:hypothetical protein